MIDPEKINEWINEVQERPESAPLIIQYIANRLRDLSSRNEELAAENIALQSGRRTEEFEARITHLEYQLELLRRQAGGESGTGEEPVLTQEELTRPPAVEKIHILVYNAQGRVLHLTGEGSRGDEARQLPSLQGELSPDGVPLRLLAASETEELLFLFTSGRVATLALEKLLMVEPDAGKTLDWRRASTPFEPRAGESLACIAPLSRLAFADAFVQVSRRGFVKKIRAVMAQSILANHYIGAGVNQPADRTFDLALCAKEDRLALVSREGYLLCLESRGLPSSIEEAIRLGLTDHLVAAFILPPGRSVLVMTQAGKVIQRAEENLEMAASLKTKGQAVFSSQRRDQGVRVVGAAAVHPDDWGIALHRSGGLTLHKLSKVLDGGAIPVENELMAFAAYTVRDAR
jgi:DNA gyrase/topoisomerase IV subunit A